MDSVIVINFLALELNSWCNLENPGFKLQDLNTCIKKKKQMQKEKSPTGLYNNGRN
jgi:hypothetical protein